MINALGEEQHPFWKPKFLITGFIVVAGTGLRIADLIGSGEWVAVCNIALTTFVAGSVVENKLMKPTMTTTHATTTKVDQQHIEGKNPEKPAEGTA